MNKSELQITGSFTSLAAGKVAPPFVPSQEERPRLKSNGEGLLSKFATDRFGHDAEVCERRLTSLQIHEIGSPGNWHWRPSGSFCAIACALICRVQSSMTAACFSSGGRSTLRIFPTTCILVSGCSSSTQAESVSRHGYPSAFRVPAR